MKSYLSLAVAVALSASGCGTIATQVIPGETCSYAVEHQDRWGCRDISRMYSGVQGNLCWVGSEMQLYAFLDLPLSLVGDTFFLPVTAYQQAKYGGLCEKDGSVVEKS